MNTRATKLLVLAALGLFAFIFFIERHHSTTTEIAKPAPILAALQPDAVTSIEVHALNAPAFTVEHKKENWQLTQPYAANAQENFITALLQVLHGLKWQSRLTPADLKDQPNPDREFGFAPPHAVLKFSQPTGALTLTLGGRTATGDALFVRVNDDPTIFLVDANLARLIPPAAAAWRDPALANLKNLNFDRVIVTNGAKVFELQRDATTKLWRMTRPLEARADNPRIADLLAKLQAAHVSAFVTDDPKADLEIYGLAPADFELTLAHGETSLLTLQLGKSPTNKLEQAFVRRAGQPSIGLIAKEEFAAWRGSPEEFRDRHLVELAAAPFDEIEARGNSNFLLRQDSNAVWRVVSPENFAADVVLVRDWLGALANLQITQFVKTVVTEPDLPGYGLAPAAAQIFIRDGTNAVTELAFSAPQAGGKVFARRADETSVYAVRPEELRKLATSAWQLRERALWNFSETNVTRLTLKQRGVTRELVHGATNQWSFAAGSEGIINTFAVEEAVHRLGQLGADAWLARGESERARFGFSADSGAIQLTLEVKTGEQVEKFSFEFAPAANGHPPTGVIALDGQPWFFDVPPAVAELVTSYLNLDKKEP
ncbi:MAG: hypothetical protein RLZZ350_1497 [Verrucomicrobiota bacterium]|jgi:hypothetical protein